MFLHGFLGTTGDWIPIMKTISSSTRCIAVDLPGHGGSKSQCHSDNDADKPNLSIDVVADVLCKVLNNLTPEKVTLVGYSMGARISLYTALKRSDKVEGAMIISGSPGLINNDARTIRKAKDDFRASTLVSNGLEFFIDTWYAEELWARSSWEDLKQCKVPLQVVVGEKDGKFKDIAREMYRMIGNSAESTAVIEIPSAGHAVYVENPLALIPAITQFIKTVKTT